MFSLLVRPAPPVIAELLILHPKTIIQTTAAARTWMCAPPAEVWCGSVTAGPDFGDECCRNPASVEACRGDMSNDFVGQFGEVSESIAHFISGGA